MEIVHITLFVLTLGLVFALARNEELKARVYRAQMENQTDLAAHQIRNSLNR